MFKSTVLAAILAAGLTATPAAAQRSGTYAVQGTDVAGARYEGSAVLTATGPETWRVTWRVAGATANGVGMTVKGTLVIGYISERETGVVAYDVMPDGSLVGRWTQGREGGVGTETLLPR